MKDPATWNLSRREVDILDAVVVHGRVDEAARMAGVKESTARSHIQSAMRKADVHCIVLLAVNWALYSR